MILRSSFLSILFAWAFVFNTGAQAPSWVRINQLGYQTQSPKTAVFASKTEIPPKTFQLIDAATNKPLLTAATGKDFGAYGPFTHTARLDFSKCTTPGDYYIICGETRSPIIHISDDAYAGAADFILKYLRQQRSGFNPFLNDSCHTHDGYTMYGPMPDTTRLDVAGGWHDATDYLQYVTTSANATFHLLAAYRDFPEVFKDTHKANGLEGSNGQADVLDEGRWGLDWLLKMHPKKDWLFHQLADDRDHHGFRLPNHDSVDYGVGPGLGRPVYFATGQPQGLGKYRNRSTGVANIAGKFASAFALGASLYKNTNPTLADSLKEKALSAWKLGLDKPGVQQTAPCREPYFYEEDDWTDDMELAAASLYQLTGIEKYHRQALEFGKQERFTPWMGQDTARHYQFYPFHNIGHYEIGQAAWLKEGIEKVYAKAKTNAFLRGVPFIWCSNNLNTSFAIQCFQYRRLTGDNSYATLEQACFDWLFGCNPWGKSMVYGLPADGDTPKHPHSSLSYLNRYPLDGGMVDGPVYGSIYRNLRGLHLFQPDTYNEFQSDLVVYHDDVGDYSTNEPTMDGTASLVYLLAAEAHKTKTTSHGAIIRGDTRKKNIALVFTGDEFGEGGKKVADALQNKNIHASFFLTGNFYRNKKFNALIQRLKSDGNYLGTHSDKHLLYCDWNKRDSLLVSRATFDADLREAYRELKKKGVDRQQALYFLPPYEWYNDSIAKWTQEAGLRLINFTPGTRSNADYTTPDMGTRYLPSDSIINSILTFEQTSPAGLNGFILLLHLGTDPARTDKTYDRLPALIQTLKTRGYSFVRIDELLK